MASAGKARDCPLPGRRLSRGLSRGGAAESAPPTPGGRPRYRQAGGDPPLRGTRHRAMCTRRGGAGEERVTSREVSQHVPRGLLPSNRRNDYPGGDSGPVKGAPSGASLRDDASATLDWTWPRVPRAPKRLSD